MTDEKSRLAARADVAAAIDEARDLAEHRFGSASRPEVVMAIAAELLAAYRWHKRATPLIPAIPREFQPHD